MNYYFDYLKRKNKYQMYFVFEQENDTSVYFVQVFD
jgi:hypothetical protein